jgi:hypothetical protein
MVYSNLAFYIAVQMNLEKFQVDRFSQNHNDSLRPSCLSTSFLRRCQTLENVIEAAGIAKLSNELRLKTFVICCHADKVGFEAK